MQVPALCGFRTNLLRAQHHTFCRTCELRSAARACASSASCVSRSSRFSSALRASCALAVASRFASRSSADNDSCTQHWTAEREHICWHRQPVTSTRRRGRSELLDSQHFRRMGTNTTLKACTAWSGVPPSPVAVGVPIPHRAATWQLRVPAWCSQWQPARQYEPAHTTIVADLRRLLQANNSSTQLVLTIVWACKGQDEAKVCMETMRTQHLFPSLVGCCLRCCPMVLARFQWCKTLDKTLSTQSDSGNAWG